MVAVGDDKRPTAVPPFVPTTPEEHRRVAAAQRRHALRKQLDEIERSELTAAAGPAG